MDQGTPATDTAEDQPSDTDQVAPAAETVVMDRIQKALAEIDRNGLGLEVGPSHNPVAPKRNGFNVHIVDYLGQEGLREKYAGHVHLGVNLDNIEAVDFIWSGQSLPELIGREACYDWIIASHVIEHIPDLVSFLQQCQALLTPSGRLSLIVPDMRYCFDHFNRLSTTGDFLDSFDQKRTRPSAGQVFDFAASASRRGGATAWAKGTEGDFDLIHSTDQACDQWRQARTASHYIDVHCWRFTPDSFRLILADLHRLGLTELSIIREFDTTGCEFYVTLAKSGDPAPMDRLEALKKITQGISTM
jgi:hypothetical protein